LTLSEDRNQSRL